VLKEWVSHAVESGLYHLGYPIARRGVVLTIGRYDLLVADACSGLNSIVALTALVSLMVYLRRHPSRTYNALMIASILPIALFANFARVLCLTLVTYYGGISAFERAHDMAGLLVFAISILSFYALDAVLTRCLADKKQLEEHNAQPQH
jgi:exosortase